MLIFTNRPRKQLICQRVRKIRVEHFGEGRGAQKKMAKELEIPYTTYRGYEENRVNDDFLRLFAEKFDVPLLWLLCADIPEPAAKPKGDEPNVLINAEKGLLKSSRYKIIQLMNDSMEPTLAKGAWVGIRTKPIGDLNGKIVGIKKDDQTLVRRIVIKDKTILAIADNPSFIKDSLAIRKSDVIGEVAWSWQKF